MTSFDDARANVLRLLSARPELTLAFHTQLSRLFRVMAQSESDVSQYQASAQLAVDQARRGFDMKSCEAYKFFEERDWHRTHWTSMVSIGKVMAYMAGLEFNRDQKRHKDLFFKWLSDNWSTLRPLVETMRLLRRRDIDDADSLPV
jgi:hypothetical protein